MKTERRSEFTQISSELLRLGFNSRCPLNNAPHQFRDLKITLLEKDNKISISFPYESTDLSPGDALPILKGSETFNDAYERLKSFVELMQIL